MGRDGGPQRKTSSSQATAREICEAMLLTVGEVGYPSTRVEDVLGRCGLSRSQFYELFSTKEECFLVGYEAIGEELCDEILKAAEDAGDCIVGLREALARFLAFVAARPATAAALLVEAPGAGDAVLVAQQQIVERLTRALEGARRQPNSIHSGPSSTAPLMIGAIENMVRGLLVSSEPERAPALLGDLLYVVVLNYFGEDAAFAAMDAARDS